MAITRKTARKSTGGRIRISTGVFPPPSPPEAGPSRITVDDIPEGFDEEIEDPKFESEEEPMEVEQPEDPQQWDLDAEFQPEAQPELPAAPVGPEVVVLDDDDEDSEHQPSDEDVSPGEIDSSEDEDEDMDEEDIAEAEPGEEDPEEFIDIVGMGTPEPHVPGVPDPVAPAPEAPAPEIPEPESPAPVFVPQPMWMTSVHRSSGLTLQFPRMLRNLLVASGLDEVTVTYIGVRRQHVLGLYPAEWHVTAEMYGPDDFGGQVVRGRHYAIAARANFDAGINDAARLALSSFCYRNRAALNQTAFRFYPQRQSGRDLTRINSGTAEGNIRLETLLEYTTALNTEHDAALIELDYIRRKYARLQIQLENGGQAQPEVDPADSPEHPALPYHHFDARTHLGFP